MGGCGSGKYYRWNAKRTTSNLDALDIRWLSRKGLLEKGANATVSFSTNGIQQSSVGFSVDEKACRIRYRSTSKVNDQYNVDQRIVLLSTPCNLGGERMWFQCPTFNCNRRVAILYCGRTVACRTCLRLSYKSQNESSLDRKLRKGQKLYRSMGRNRWWLTDQSASRPKGMHRATYVRKSVVLGNMRSQALGAFSNYIEKSAPNSSARSQNCTGTTSQ